jgi:hypothetical protein
MSFGLDSRREVIAVPGAMNFGGPAGLIGGSLPSDD